jgi:hypothetical protein
MPRRALGRDTSALPLTRWRSGALQMHRTASFPIHHVKQRSLLRSRDILAPGFFLFLPRLSFRSPTEGMAERREAVSIILSRP